MAKILVHNFSIFSPKCWITKFFSLILFLLLKCAYKSRSRKSFVLQTGDLSNDHSQSYDATGNKELAMERDLPPKHMIIYFEKLMMLFFVACDGFKCKNRSYQLKGMRKFMRIILKANILERRASNKMKF